MSTDNDQSNISLLLLLLLLLLLFCILKEEKQEFDVHIFFYAF
jgi:hypothetical protein